MGDRLAGKTALVTAAGQGIGRAIAVALAREGARVIATNIASESFAALAREHPAIDTRLLDVTDTDAIARLAQEHDGPLNVLVNCAGWVHHGSILACSDTDWQRTMALNLTAMFHMCKALLPRMLFQGGGSIVNIASVASSIAGVADRFAYATSKAGVIGLTKAIAMDFITSGVRCNAIAPGTIDTPSLQERMAAGGDYDEARRRFIARQPMGRLGTAEEIAALAVYLAGDESAFTTGQVFVCDGGMTL